MLNHQLSWAFELFFGPQQLGRGSTVKLSEPDYHLAPHPCRAFSLETTSPYLGVPWGAGAVKGGETHRQIRIRPMWTRHKGCLVGGPACPWPPRVIKWHGAPFKLSWLFFTPLRTHIFWKVGREGWFSVLVPGSLWHSPTPPVLALCQKIMRPCICLFVCFSHYLRGLMNYLFDSFFFFTPTKNSGVS